MTSPEAGRQPDFQGQKVEGFEAGKEFPASITFQGLAFERGFQDKAGNTFYSRPLEQHPLRQFLLVSPEGVIVNHVQQDLAITKEIQAEQAALAEADRTRQYVERLLKKDNKEES